MAQRASARKLARALEMAHEYVNRVCADLEPDQMGWRTAGCPETVGKQLRHLIQAERYFAARMGWETPRKRRDEHPLAEYARLLEMHLERRLPESHSPGTSPPCPQAAMAGCDGGWAELHLGSPSKHSRLSARERHCTLTRTGLDHSLVA